MTAQHLIFQTNAAEVVDLLGVELQEGRFVQDKSGVRLVEIYGAAFVADRETIFGELNREYVARELEWYAGMSLNVEDIPPPVPAIWRQVADKDGFINSNYGWMLYSEENGSQYDNVLAELRSNPASRRAVAIYTRPSMWRDYNLNGRSDFCCTNAVQYLIRDGRLQAVVQMRSNDAVFGYKNDFAWQQNVQRSLALSLGVEPGEIFWQAGSLHVYERHFFLVDHYNQTGETTITKARYAELYPDSPWK